MTAITRKLLAGLRANHIHAIGFVNESQLEDDPAGRTALLARWLDAGMDLGNHTFSHPSLNTLPVDDYIADAAKGDAVTRQSSTPRTARSRAGSASRSSKPGQRWQSATASPRGCGATATASRR